MKSQKFSGEPGASSSWGLGLKRTEESSDDDFAGLDVEDDDAVEWVLGVEASEAITFVDFGVCGTSCGTPTALVPDKGGMTNRSGLK
jgi:hypothetical protein